MFGSNKWDDLLGGSSTYNFPSGNLGAFGISSNNPVSRSSDEMVGNTWSSLSDHSGALRAAGIDTSNHLATHHFSNASFGSGAPVSHNPFISYNPFTGLPKHHHFGNASSGSEAPVSYNPFISYNPFTGLPKHQHHFGSGLGLVHASGSVSYKDGPFKINKTWSANYTPPVSAPVSAPPKPIEISTNSDSNVTNALKDLAPDVAVKTGKDIAVESATKSHSPTTDIADGDANARSYVTDISAGSTYSHSYITDANLSHIKPVASSSITVSPAPANSSTKLDVATIYDNAVKAATVSNTNNTNAALKDLATFDAGIKAGRALAKSATPSEPVNSSSASNQTSNIVLDSNLSDTCTLGNIVEGCKDAVTAPSTQYFSTGYAITGGILGYGAGDFVGATVGATLGGW